MSDNTLIHGAAVLAAALTKSHRNISMKSKPFKRVLALYAAVTALMKANPEITQEKAFNAMPEYRSRGKGKGGGGNFGKAVRLPRLGKSYPEAKARDLALAQRYNATLRNAAK